MNVHHTVSSKAKELEEAHTNRLFIFFVVIAVISFSAAFVADVWRRFYN